MRDRLSYVLSKDAEEDLRKIIRYTNANFGQAQTRKYSTQLELCIDRLSKEQRRYRTLPDIDIALRY